MMHTVGIVNLGVSDEYFSEFKTNLINNLNNGWLQGTFDFHYKNIDQKEIMDQCDTLVLSPGDAKVGLLTAERAEKDPGIPKLYDLIEKAVDEGIPLLGVNAGHEAINCAYGWAIDKIPDNVKKAYQKETRVDVNKLIIPDQCIDQIFKDIGMITIKLSNGYAVLPREKQAKRPNQDKVTQLVDFMGYPLISRVESEAPVYGVQFNIQDGTNPIFRNFFELARKYLERKQG